MVPLLHIKLFIPPGKVAQPFPQRRSGLKAKIPLQRGGVRISYGYVTGLHGYQLFVGFKIVIGRQNSGGNQLLLQFVIWGIYTFCITLLVYGTVYVIFNRKIIRKYLTRIGK